MGKWLRRLLYSRPEREHAVSARLSLPVHFGTLFTLTVLAAVMIYGYLYVTELSGLRKLSAGRVDLSSLEREQSLLDENHWARSLRDAVSLRRWSNAESCRIGLLSTTRVLLARADIENTGGLYRQIQELEQAVVQSNLLPENVAPRTPIETLLVRQTELEPTIIRTRFEIWHPLAEDLLRRTARFVLYFVVFVTLAAPLSGAFFRTIRARADRMVPRSTWYLLTLGLWMFFVYCTMLASGRARNLPLPKWVRASTPFNLILLMIGLLVLAWCLHGISTNKLNPQFVRAAGFKLRFPRVATNWWLGGLARLLRPQSREAIATMEKALHRAAYVSLFLALLMLGGAIAGGSTRPVYGVFRVAPDSGAVVADRANLLALGMETGIATALLAITLLFVVFPAVLRHTIYVPEDDPTPTFGDEVTTRFWKYHCWGWNRHYHYYMAAILRMHSVSIVIGAIGTVSLMAIPFLFSSAGYYVGALLLSGRLDPGTILKGLVLPSALVGALSVLAAVLTSHLRKHRARFEQTGLCPDRTPRGRADLRAALLPPLVAIIAAMFFPYKTIGPIAWVAVALLIGLAMGRRLSRSFGGSEFGVADAVLPAVVSTAFIVVASVLRPPPLFWASSAFAIVVVELWLASRDHNPGRRHWQVFVPVITAFVSTAAVLLLWARASPDFASGILYKLFSVQAASLPSPEPAALIGALLPLVALWVSPVVLGLDSTDTILLGQTAFVLRRVLTRLRDHTVLYGYGDLGKKVAAGIVKRAFLPETRIARSDPLVPRRVKFAEVLSTRRQEFVDVSTNLVVVDKSAGAFSEVHADEEFGQVGLCDIDLGESDVRRPGQRLENDIVAAGIVGDCREPRVHDDVNMEFSRCVILAARDEGAVFPLYNAIYRRQEECKRTPGRVLPQAILGVERGTYGAYVEWRSLDRGIYFVYPSLLRGTALGEIVCQDMEKSLALMDPDRTGNVALIPKILVLGSGVQLHYVVTTIHENLRKSLGLSGKMADWAVEHKLAVVSNEDYVREAVRGASGSSGVITTRWDRWPMHPLVVEEPPKKPWFVPTRVAPAWDAFAIQRALEGFDPSIVVIASAEHMTELITQETILALERMRTSGPFPHIFVGVGENEWHRVRDALACWRKHTGDSTYYPLQQVDSVVDVHDGAATMIVSLYETLWGRASQGRVRPVELSRCSPREPGGLAEYLACLSGLEFRPKATGHGTLPMFYNHCTAPVSCADLRCLIKPQNVRQAKDVSGFCFQSWAALVPTTRYPIEGIRDGFRRSFHSFAIGAVSDDDIEAIHKILATGVEGLSGRSECCDCPRLRTCPIDATRRHISTTRNLEGLNRRAQHTDAHRHYRQTEYRRTAVVRPTTGTFAQMAVCGFGAGTPGSLARAVNLLVFRSSVALRSDRAEHVLDLHYERGFGCSHESRSYYKFYGDLVQPGPVPTATHVTALLIRPASEASHSAWMSYAGDLFREFADIDSDYRLVVTGHPAAILLYLHNERFLDATRKSFGLGNDFHDADVMILGLRGYQRGWSRKASPLCGERDTSCLFEKLRGDAQRYAIDWRTVVQKP